jgi:ribosomal protein S18 acetylase RimI-like enzyme
MNIRIASIGDINNILVLMDKTSKFHISSRPDLHDTNKKPKNDDFIKMCMDEENCKVFVAEEENNIIGYCVIQIGEIKNLFVFYDMKNIEILDFCVDEKYRKNGIGRQLFETVKNLAKENNANFIELGVWEFNQDAKKFYEHLGMKTRISRMELKVK